MSDLNDHDVLHHDRKQISKAGDEAPYPHVICCAGCRRLRICHGCGFPVSGFHARPGTLARCTSGACPRCCAALHKHPQG